MSGGIHKRDPLTPYLFYCSQTPAHVLRYAPTALARCTLFITLVIRLDLSIRLVSLS